MAPDDTGSIERERGTEGSEEEAVVPTVEREEGRSGGSGGGRGSSEPAMAGALAFLRLGARERAERGREMDHEAEQGDLILQKKGGRGGSAAWARAGQAKQGMGNGSAMCLPLNPRSAYSKKIQS